MIYQGEKKYTVRHIVIHTSATRVSWYQGKTGEEKVAEIRRWHTTSVKEGGRGWKDIGYHYVIDRDGQVYQGRKESVIGAGVVGFNSGVLHICLVGGYGGTKDDKFRTHYTFMQEESLLRVIADIKIRTRIETITGHNDHAPKDCPCFNVADWLQSKKQTETKIAVLDKTPTNNQSVLEQDSSKKTKNKVNFFTFMRYLLSSKQRNGDKK